MYLDLKLCESLKAHIESLSKAPSVPSCKCLESATSHTLSCVDECIYCKFNASACGNLVTLVHFNETGLISRTQVSFEVTNGDENGNYTIVRDLMHQQVGDSLPCQVVLNEMECNSCRQEGECIRSGKADIVIDCRNIDQNFLFDSCEVPSTPVQLTGALAQFVGIDMCTWDTL